jgi:hypothetical protein
LGASRQYVSIKFYVSNETLYKFVRNTICREFFSTTLGIGIGIDEAIEAIFDRHGKKYLLSGLYFMVSSVW